MAVTIQGTFCLSFRDINSFRVEYINIFSNMPHRIKIHPENTQRVLGSEHLIQSPKLSLS